MFRYITALLILWSTNAYCQRAKPIRIQSISLSDEVLKKEIQTMITNETNSNDPEQLFKKGLGYITVHVQEYITSDTLRVYYIEPAFYVIKENDIDGKYPFFYTYVANRLVLVYLDVLKPAVVQACFSKRTKSLLRKRISKFLEKEQSIIAYDISGKEAFRDKHFRVDRFRFDSGKYIFVLKNGTYKIKNENNFK